MILVLPGAILRLLQVPIEGNQQVVRTSELQGESLGFADHLGRQATDARKILFGVALFGRSQEFLEGERHVVGFKRRDPGIEMGKRPGILLDLGRNFWFLPGTPRPPSALPPSAQEERAGIRGMPARSFAVRSSRSGQKPDPAPSPALVKNAGKRQASSAYHSSSMWLVS